MNDKQLIITRHAYERYCERVGMISREDLHALVSEHIKQPQRRKRDYIQIGGVWWRFGIEGNQLKLYTCYGKHMIDLPAAITWAKQNNDRINLGYGN